MFNLFRLYRKDKISFDIVAERQHCCQKRQQYRNNVQLVAFDNVASTLLLVWTGLTLQGLNSVGASGIQHVSLELPHHTCRLPRAYSCLMALCQHRRSVWLLHIFHSL